MKTYSLLLLLQGNADFSVPKENVLAPEVSILHALHGADAVTNIVEAPATEDWAFADRLKYSSSETRKWLDAEYGDALRFAKTSVAAILGPESMPLPTSVEGATLAAPVAAPARQKASKAPATPVAAPPLVVADAADIAELMPLGSEVE